MGGSSSISSGDTAFVLSGAALVLLMTPGLAMFYGGMVRRKNVLSILMQCFILMCLIGVQWIIIGYSLAFGPDLGHFIGSLRWIGLRGVGFMPNPEYAATIPGPAFMIFQAMFAVITPALFIGAFAERVKFAGFFAFVLLWSVLVYDPVAHWVWGAGGWLRNLGALDFAGGTVVHISAGIAALALCLLIGRRKGFNQVPMAPHNLPFTVLGGGLLWFGWFGFNSASALAANEVAVNAFVTTNTASAAAGLTWALIEWIFKSKPTMLGTVSGAVAGLVAITPGAGFVGPLSAILVGMGAGSFCYLAVTRVKTWFGYDDSLDVFGVHCIGGIWGAFATGLFAQKALNPAGNNGLFFGNPKQLLLQLAGIGSTLGYSLVISVILYLLIDKTIGMRVEERDEEEGLDLSQHRESAYGLEGE
jgi:Amt family ammonium transporter